MTMALIKCKECGKEVSDQATVCIPVSYTHLDVYKRQC